MNTKIKILCIVLSLIYGGLILKSIIPSFEIFMAGVEMGRESAEKDTNYEVFHFNVAPKTQSYTFTSTVVNTATGEELEAEVTGYKVKVNNPSEYTTAGNVFIFLLKLICSLVFLVLIIYLPFLFFKIIKASTKGNMIDRGVIKNISRMGWSLLILFAMETFVVWLDLRTAKQLIELENYKLMMDFSGYYLLILGTVILLLAEVLKESLNMKEEQDLTI